ncbi:MAG: hypothetical protein ACI9CO_002318, partial [Candidatus Azotimanducaceae bacterium]
HEEYVIQEKIGLKESRKVNTYGENTKRRLNSSVIY